MDILPTDIRQELFPKQEDIVVNPRDSEKLK